MVLRLQAFQFDLRPHGQQIRNLRQFAGSCRFVYNKALALNLERYEKKEKRLGYAGLCALLPNWKMEHQFLSAVPAQALQQSLKNLERAYTNFFRKRADFPKFKKKGQRESFRIPQAFEIDNQNGRIKLPKLGWMRYRKSQDILGEASNVTVSESCGKWYVSVQTEREAETPQHPSTSAVGMDWGVVNFVTLSDGEVVDHCQPLKKFLPKLAKLQRRMARRTAWSTGSRRTTLVCGSRSCGALLRASNVETWILLCWGAAAQFTRGDRSPVAQRVLNGRGLARRSRDANERVLEEKQPEQQACPSAPRDA